ncbi:hypothetical protein V502_04576 [Pseudogymnoascus sp. VKM F-4520 (FW-2644)]|nr:hypothetical protein V502_04576 [Pseudogymnoascus sp. VKM F-4520 (FW-2644)]
MRFLPLPDWCLGVRGRTLLGVCTEEIQAELATERAEREARDARDAQAQEREVEDEPRWRYRVGVLGGLSFRSRSSRKVRERSKSKEREMEKEREMARARLWEKARSARSLERSRATESESEDKEEEDREEEDKEDEDGAGGNVDRGKKGLRPNRSFASLFRGLSHGS